MAEHAKAIVKLLGDQFASTLQDTTVVIGDVSAQAMDQKLTLIFPLQI